MEDRVHLLGIRHHGPGSAARLRRHLEFVASDLADELGAKVHYRADGGYDMGELLSAVIGRQGELLKQAARAAKSWGDSEQIAKVADFQDARNKMLAERDGEQWIINKAIHYNEWADLSKNDFRPVVVAFRQLLQQFRCDKPKCDSWLSISPRVSTSASKCGRVKLPLETALQAAEPIVAGSLAHHVIRQLVVFDKHGGYSRPPMLRGG